MTERSVARYYDANTARFLRFGGGRGSHAIHRQLWGPGVSTVREASSYVNVLLLREIEDLSLDGAVAVLDLGCGVGGTLFELAQGLPTARMRGVTISGRQRDMAEHLATSLGLDGRCRFTEGDFETVRLAERADVVVAVESFVHGSSPGAFFATAAAHLSRGGRLVIVDDFLARERGALDAAARRGVRSAEVGWRLSSLDTVEACVRVARSEGFELLKVEDLTALIRLGRLRDRCIAALAPLFQAVGLARLPFFANMIGGNAIRSGVGKGWLAYRLVVLART